jgi:hypothetical protein
MRDLTPEECEFIAGGKGQRVLAMSYSGEGDIVVTASPPSFPPNYPPAPPPSAPAPGAPSTGGYTGGGSTPAPSYNSPNSSDAANTFANNHVKNYGSTAEDTVVYQNEHDKLASLYDHLTNDPDRQISLGNGRSISASQALADLSKGTTYITDSALHPAGQNGAPGDNATVPAYTMGSSNGTVESWINPSQAESLKYENLNPSYSYQGTSGMDYVDFHELGHQIQWTEDRSLFDANNNGTTESEANSIGRSLEQAAGITLITGGNGVPITPLHGYYNEK